MMSRRSSVRCQSVPTIGFRNHHLSQTLSQRLTRNCHLTYSLTKLRNGAGRKSIRKVNLKAPKSFEKWPRGPHDPNPPPNGPRTPPRRRPGSEGTLAVEAPGSARVNSSATNSSPPLRRRPFLAPFLLSVPTCPDQDHHPQKQPPFQGEN